MRLQCMLEILDHLNCTWYLADVLARTSILVTDNLLSAAAQCFVVFSLEVLSENLGIF